MAPASIAASLGLPTRLVTCAAALLLSGCAGAAPTATAAPAVALPPLPADSAAASAAPSAPPAPAAAAPAGSSEAAPQPDVALAPLPTPAEAPPQAPPAAPPSPAPQAPPAAAPPRVLLVDEPPYVPTRLHAHDGPRSEHRRSHETSREAKEAGGRRPYHPAPGIVVDVVDVQGGAPAVEVQRVARSSGYWPFRQCYEEGLRKDQRLAGKVSLELAVSPNGAVDRSTMTVATVRDEVVAACVAREARHLPLPSSESAATAKIDVTLATGDEPVPAGRPIPDADGFRQALRASWDSVRQCYATGLANHPDIGGRLELHFRLRRGGEVAEVAEVGEHDSRFSDAEVTRCVVGVYRAARPLAASASHAHSAKDRSFVYALHFESKPADAPVP